MLTKSTMVVVADDDPQLLRLLVRNLQLEGYEVLAASDGEQALAHIIRYKPDLVLLDVMMPRMDGFTVCQKVREFSAIPIIIVTARSQDQDKIRGLDMGADDYLAKPFSVTELLARVHAVLRRARLHNDDATCNLQTNTIGEVTIHYDRHIVKRADQEIMLTPIEYRLLVYLTRHAGRIVTQDELLEYTWGPQYLQEKHLLQVNINRLRNKLEVDPAHPQYILTKAGVGYLLPVQPTLTAV